MGKINTGGPAFPRPMGSAMTGCGPEYNQSQNGMSLRDYMIGQALVGMLAQYAFLSPEQIARKATAVADAVLKVRLEVPDENS